MLIAFGTYEVISVHSRPRLTVWLKVVALFVVLVFTLLEGQAIAAASPNGEIAGLKAKFVNVKGVRTRYYERGQGELLVQEHSRSCQAVPRYCAR
jgi:hypothetical protein